MPQPLYRYNEKTCQYERTGVNPFDVLWYVLCVFVCAVGVLAAMLFVHDYFVDSEKEITLRKENAALKKHKVVLTGQLATIESTLQSLQQDDEKLHVKLFGASVNNGQSVERTGIADENILLADAKLFRAYLEKVRDESSHLLTASSQSSKYFGNTIALEREQFSLISSIPVSQPVHPWNSEKLISGFGTRVNPFHKGLYDHPGVDISMPRGTEVTAAASGTVSEVKRSDLQAGYGNYVEVDHGHGFVTRYAHLEEIHVRNGQKIQKGSVLGTIGSSGGSIAPHLHYEIIRDGKNVDPTLFMIEGLSSAEHEHLKQIGNIQNQSLD